MIAVSCNLTTAVVIAVSFRLIAFRNSYPSVSRDGMLRSESLGHKTRASIATSLTSDISCAVDPIESFTGISTALTSVQLDQIERASCVLYPEARA